MANSSSRFANLDNFALITIFRENPSATAYSICKDQLFPANVSMTNLRRQMLGLVKTGHLPESASPLNEDAQPDDFDTLPGQGSHKTYTDHECRQLWDWAQSRPDPTFRNILKMDIPTLTQILPGRTLSSLKLKLASMMKIVKKDGLNETGYPGPQRRGNGYLPPSRDRLPVDPATQWAKWTFDDEERLRHFLLSRKEPFRAGIGKADVDQLKREFPGRSWESVRNKSMKLMKMIRAEYELASENETDNGYEADGDDNDSSDDLTPLFEFQAAQASTGSGKQAVKFANVSKGTSTKIPAKTDGVTTDEWAAQVLLDLHNHDSQLRYIDHPEEMSTDSELTDLPSEMGETPTDMEETLTEEQAAQALLEEMSTDSDLTDLSSEMDATSSEGEVNQSTTHVVAPRRSDVPRFMSTNTEVEDSDATVDDGDDDDYDDEMEL